MRIVFLIITLLLTTELNAESNNQDWRKTGSAEEKLENVVQVIPSAADIMFQMGERYRNLYWAGKQGKGEFAQYQSEEMQRLVKNLMLTRPNRAATAQTFLADAFEGYEQAIQQKDWKK